MFYLCFRLKVSQLTVLCVAVADGKTGRLLTVGGIGAAVMLVVARTVNGRLKVGLVGGEKT